jgi:hypothetical protein
VIFGIVFGEYLIAVAVAPYALWQTVIWVKYPHLARRRKKG